MNPQLRTLLAGWVSGLLPLAGLAASAEMHADPFVKTPGAAVPLGAHVANSHMTVVLEIYSLDQNDAVAILETAQASQERYRIVRKFEAENRARLSVFTAISSNPGEHVETRSVDEIRWPSGFQPALRRTSTPLPTETLQRKAGDVFDLNLGGIADRSCRLDVYATHTTLLGFRDIAGMPDDPPVSLPGFSVQKLSTSLSCNAGQLYFVGTISPATGRGVVNEGRAELQLAFVRACLVPVQAVVNEGTKPAASPANDAGPLQIEYSWYSLDRKMARDLLGPESKPAAWWDELQALRKQGKARVEHLVSIRTASGQRAHSEATQEVDIPTAFKPPTLNGDASGPEITLAPSQRNSSMNTPGVPANFEPQSVGLSVEVEPVENEEHTTADLDFAIRNNVDIGNIETTGAARRGPQLPVFEVREFRSAMHVANDRHYFIGTLNSPSVDGVNGRTDNGKAILGFVQVTRSKD